MSVSQRFFLLAAFTLALAINSSFAQVIYLSAQGVWAGATFGGYCSGCPDVNGDGCGDVLVGVPNEFLGQPLREYGAAYVFSGHDGTLIRQLVSPRAIPIGRFGYSVSGSPDLNGDGLGEIIVGAYAESSTYVFSGANGALLYDLRPGQSAAGFGSGVATIPDTNDDGIPDIAVGAQLQNGERGQVYVFSGATGKKLTQFGHPRPTSSSRFGGRVCGIPDLDFDGAGDILVGCPNEVIRVDDVLIGIGRCYVYSGRTGTLIREIDPPNAPVGGIGASITGIPDLNGDGAGDYAIGDHALGYRIGHVDSAVYVYSGIDGSLLATLRSPLNPVYWFGTGVAGVPDLDGDGRGDLIVGAALDRWPGSPVEAGAAYVYSGASFRLLRRYVSPDPGAPRNGTGARFGVVVAGVPDTSGDGRYEVVAGAPGDCAHEPCPPNQPGRCYIFPSCPADYNYDGVLNSQDFYDFLVAYFTQLPGGDYNRDSTYNSQDLFDFLAAFFAGCP